MKILCHVRRPFDYRIDQIQGFMVLVVLLHFLDLHMRQLLTRGEEGIDVRFGPSHVHRGVGEVMIEIWDLDINKLRTSIRNSFQPRVHDAQNLFLRTEHCRQDAKPRATQARVASRILKANLGTRRRRQPLIEVYAYVTGILVWNVITTYVRCRSWWLCPRPRFGA